MAQHSTGCFQQHGVQLDAAISCILDRRENLPWVPHHLNNVQENQVREVPIESARDFDVEGSHWVRAPRHTQTHPYSLELLSSSGIQALEFNLCCSRQASPPCWNLPESGECHITSFHAFLPKSDFVIHVTAETATEQGILEINSASREEQWPLPRPAKPPP